VIVPDYQLSLAIGREGQNARLAARLTGWRIDIKSESQAQEVPTPAPARAVAAPKPAETPAEPADAPSESVVADLPEEPAAVGTADEPADGSPDRPAVAEPAPAEAQAAE
jgi:N utilization substance protein A